MKRMFGRLGCAPRAAGTKCTRRTRSEKGRRNVRMSSDSVTYAPDSGSSPQGVGLSGKVLPVALQKRRDIVWTEIDLAVDALGFAGFQAADAKVAVQAGDYSLKQLLIG